MKPLFRPVKDSAQLETQTDIFQKKTAAASLALASIYFAIVVEQHEGLEQKTFKAYQEHYLPDENYHNVLDQAKCSYYIILFFGKEYLSICSRAFIRQLAKLESDEDKESVIAAIKKRFKVKSLQKKHLTADIANQTIDLLFGAHDEETSATKNTHESGEDTAIESGKLPSTKPSVNPTNKAIDRKIKRMQEIRNELDTYDGSIGLTLHLSRVIKKNLKEKEKQTLLNNLCRYLGIVIEEEQTEELI